jgi:hypothetical protein
MVLNRKSHRGSGGSIAIAVTSYTSTSSGDNAPVWSTTNMFVGIGIGMCMCIMVLMTRLGESTVDIRSRWSDLAMSYGMEKQQQQQQQQQQRLPRRTRHPLFSETWDIFQRIEAEQTGRVFNETRTDPPLVQREVHFLTPEQLHKNDTFSASWLQRTLDFMTMPLAEIATDEDATYFAYTTNNNDNNKDNFRMTMDWLDFG